MNSEQTRSKQRELHPLIEYTQGLQKLGTLVNDEEAENEFYARMDELWWSLTSAEQQLVERIKLSGDPTEEAYVDLDPVIYGVPKIRIK